MAKNKKEQTTIRKAKPHLKRPHPAQFRLSNNTMTNMALGATAGCAIGAIAALLLVPKRRGHKFTQKMDEFYDQVTDAAEEYAHDALEKGQQAYQAAKDTAENIYCAAADTLTKNPKRNFVLGAICAGLIGATAIYTLTQKSSPASFAERWGTKKWTDMAKHVVDAVSTKLSEASEEHEEGRGPMQNALNWAEVGLNLWQEFKKGR